MEPLQITATPDGDGWTLDGKLAWVTNLGPQRFVVAAQHSLAELAQQLLDGVADGRFVTAAPALFRLRIALAELVQQALMLELQAKGGHAYLEQEQDGFARRWPGTRHRRHERRALGVGYNGV